MNDGPETFPVRLANLENVVSALKDLYREIAKDMADSDSEIDIAMALNVKAILEAIDRMESYLKV